MTSPTLASQIEAVLNIFPQARWIQYEPLGGGVAEALGRAFGQRVEPRLKLENADVILSLDGDFMDCGPGEIRNARAFADRRRLEGGVTTMNRLYMVESRTSNTGTKADHRLAVRAADVDAVARAIAAKLGVAGVTAGALPPKVHAGLDRRRGGRPQGGRCQGAGGGGRTADRQRSRCWRRR